MSEFTRPPVDETGINERIARRVRDLRTLRGYTLDALAARSGVSRSMISLIERASASPTAVVLDKLAAGLALFGMANVPFVYISVNYWRTIHPATSVVPTLPVDMGLALWFAVACFLLLFVLLLRLRVYLEEQRARLDALYLSLDE